MDTKELVLQEYVGLFKKYHTEYIQAKQAYMQKFKMEELAEWPVKDYPGYFEIEELWKQKRAELDAPILATAKYKLYDDVEFRCTGATHPFYDPSHKFYDSFKDLDVLKLSHGVIMGIKTSAMGDGQILYHFRRLVPATATFNPSCAEEDIIGLYKNNPNYRPDKKIIIDDDYWNEDKDYYKCSICRTILTNKEIARINNFFIDDNGLFVTPCTECFEKKIQDNENKQIVA